MHTTTARTLAMVITTSLFAAVLTVVGQTSPAEAAAKYCTGVEANSSVTAAKAIEVNSGRRSPPISTCARSPAPVRSRQRPV